jgi:hypothetical protein
MSILRQWGKVGKMKKNLMEMVIFYIVLEIPYPGPLRGMEVLDNFINANEWNGYGLGL